MTGRGRAIKLNVLHAASKLLGLPLVRATIPPCSELKWACQQKACILVKNKITTASISLGNPNQSGEAFKEPIPSAFINAESLFILHRMARTIPQVLPKEKLMAADVLQRTERI